MSPADTDLARFDTLPDSAVVSISVVCDLFDFSRATAWRRVADRTLPQPVRLGSLVRWRVGELRAVLTGLSPNPSKGPKRAHAALAAKRAAS
jgi:predicted DNA-binding transcriptional regulator AlpA